VINKVDTLKTAVIWLVFRQTGTVHRFVFDRWWS